MPLRVAVCGLGLEAYWPQFNGLKQKLDGFLETTARKLAKPGLEVTQLGLIDTPIRAREAGRECRRTEADLLVLYITTYALSSTVLPLVQRAAIPVLVLNLQPTAAIDYAAFGQLPDRTAMTRHWLTYCASCPAPEIANVLSRAGLPFHQVTGVLDDDATWTEIEEWIEAARVQSVLRDSRLGLLGHYYTGMLDVATDITDISITFGIDLDMLEVDELSALRDHVSVREKEARVQTFREHFDVQHDCSETELARAAQTSVALDRFVSEHQLDLLAYYYKGSGNQSNENTMSSIILGTSLLTARHIPVAGEYEVKNAVAMKILDTLGAGGSFTEYYAVDFTDDIVLMGHDGPGHIAIAQGRTKVRPLQVYHGKVGSGLSVEMSVQYGSVTLLSVVEHKGGTFKLLVAHGMCEGGPTLPIGNTNSRFRFAVGARRFVELWNAQGPAHHCAVGIGHVAPKLEKLAKLIGIPMHQIC